MQSWGCASKFDVRRDTAREPSKSGVLGLVAAALGIGRAEDARIRELAKLRFGVRVDQEGQLLRDFHTARAQGIKNPSVTNRYYLSDAVFVAGLESDDAELLGHIAEALRNPVFPLYLGRRSCPPMGRSFLDIVPEPLEKALREYPCQAKGRKPTRLLLDANPNQRGGLVRDVPVSWNPTLRLHAFRYVTEIHIGREESAEHNPFAELE